MASSIKSAGQAVCSTSGERTKRPSRSALRQEHVQARLCDHLHTFAPASCVEGSWRGHVAVFQQLRDVRTQLGSDDPHAFWRAYLQLRMFMASAGVARLTVPPKGGARMTTREWAGFEALHPLVELVLAALPHIDLAKLEAENAAKLERGRRWIESAEEDERARFVQRMRQGREQAKARRAQGGAA